MKKPLCPTCATELAMLDVPRGLSIGVCPGCQELAQKLATGEIVPISSMLEAHALGDDRMRAAVSQPRVSTTVSVLERIAAARAFLTTEMAALETATYELCVQATNRLDFAIPKLSSMAFVDPNAEEALLALREVQALLSSLRSANRGLPRGGQG